MRIHKLATGSIAALVLALAVGSASASRISVSNRNFRLSWAPLSFAEPVLGAEVECNVILEGSFHSATIRKLTEALIGFISRARVEATPACSNGRIYMLNGTELQGGRAVANTLPWHIRYDRFIGTLPDIYMEVFIVGASILLEFAFENCLYRSTVTRPWYGTWVRSPITEKITGFLNNELGEIPLQTGTFCPEVVYPAQTAGVALLNSTTSIFLRLI